MNKTFLTLNLIILTLFSTLVVAGSSYTAKKLNQMIAIGKYPILGETINTQNKSIKFSDCKPLANKIITEFSQSYPTKTVVDTRLIYMVEAWKNDAIIIITCSEANKTMELAEFAYQ